MMSCSGLNCVRPFSGDGEWRAFAFVLAILVGVHDGDRGSRQVHQRVLRLFLASGVVGYSGVVAEFLEAATKDNSVGVLIHVGIVLHANHGLHVEEYQSRGFPVDPFLGAAGGYADCFPTVCSLYV